jgi:putative oxidoreductase
MPAHRLLALLRRLVALLMAAHGVYRAVTAGAVEGFGGWLTLQGLPAGDLLAAAITGAELLGAVVLWLGWGRRLVAMLFVAELSVGIILVHAPEGWFVVGGGRNGVEFSVLLIGVLLAVAAERPAAAADQ